MPTPSKDRPQRHWRQACSVTQPTDGSRTPTRVGAGLVGRCTLYRRSRASAAASSTPTKRFETPRGARIVDCLGSERWKKETPPKPKFVGGGGGVGVGADSRHIWSRSVLGFWPKTVRGFGLHKIQPKVFLARLSAIVNEEVISLLRIRQYSITGRCGLVAKPMPLPRGRQTSLVSLSLLARSFGVSVPTDTDISVLELVFDQPFDAYSNHALTPTFLPLRAKQLPRTCHGSRECRSFHG